jgi:hypothetical protein
MLVFLAEVDSTFQAMTIAQAQLQLSPSSPPSLFKIL